MGTKYTKRLLGLALGLCIAPAGVHSQTNYVPAGSAAYSSPDPDQPGDSILTIKKRVDEVNVLFIATDKRGKFVRNLNQADFAILDDHKPPQTIVNFRRETDLPIELGLLVDTSGSVHGRFDFEQDAAVSFLNHTVRANFDRAFVMGFSTHGKVTQDFTDNVRLLETGVHSLHNGGGTALYDAIYRACKDKLVKDPSGRPSRRAIVVLSDGEDNQSDVTREQAIEMAQRAEVIIYAISTDDSGLILRGDKSMQLLADATGGKAFFPYKMKDVTRAFSAIEDELRSQYVVSYRPADFDADGRYRAIEITSLKKRPASSRPARLLRPSSVVRTLPARVVDHVLLPPSTSFPVLQSKQCGRKFPSPFCKPGLGFTNDFSPAVALRSCSSSRLRQRVRADETGQETNPGQGQAISDDPDGTVGCATCRASLAIDSGTEAGGRTQSPIPERATDNPGRKFHLRRYPPRGAPADWRRSRPAVQCHGTRGSQSRPWAFT